MDAVTEDAEHGTGSHDIGVKTFLPESVVLGKTRLINEVHRLLCRVLDVLVIRSKCEEELVEHFHMALGFYIKRFFHRASTYKDRHIAV